MQSKNEILESLISKHKMSKEYRSKITGTEAVLVAINNNITELLFVMVDIRDLIKEVLNETD